ncbi:protein PALS2-like isoform X2 [Amphiura filiformis]|uniref:protein PALS2-like isoform X2 n=1 Tax=Amphiura filiformis TaxID=82378 RepID=UPI003B211D28
MPVATGHDGQVAMDAVMDNLHTLGNSSARAQSVDLLFLKEVMQSRLMQNLVKAHDTLEETELKPALRDSMGLINDVIDDISPYIADDDDAAELAGILQDTHFLSLTKTHDRIAEGEYEQPTLYLERGGYTMHPPSADYYPMGDAIRMVGVRKSKDESLGITLAIEHNEIVVARVLHGGIIERQGLLHVGDIIKEINGIGVTNDPDALQEHMKAAEGSVTLKILPSYRDHVPAPPIHFKAFYDYTSSEDTLLPCTEVGLSFKKGDILCIVDREDVNYWQAYVVGGDGTTGLIPSRYLEEKRKAFVPKENMYADQVTCGVFQGKRKKHENYQTRKNYQFDRGDIVIYEEVQEMPPFQRKTLVLIGAQGIGRRTLKNRLLETEPTQFGHAIAHTSRRPREGEENGVEYFFSMRDEMEEDIKDNKFLEYGEFGANLYGTTFEAIRLCNKSGRMCVLDVNPQSLKMLRNSEFLPFVVFLKSPALVLLRSIHDAAGDQETVTDQDLQKTVDESARIERHYSHLFDLTIVNTNIEESFQKLMEAIDLLGSQRQWVPVDWVYDSPIMPGPTHV